MLDLPEAVRCERQSCNDEKRSFHKDFTSKKNFFILHFYDASHFPPSASKIRTDWKVKTLKTLGPEPWSSGYGRRLMFRSS